MRICFFNADFDPARYEGSRVHIEQLIKYLIDLGQEVWVGPNSSVNQAKKLSNDRLKRISQLRMMDVYYFRVTGGPVAMPRYMYKPWNKFGFDKAIVWEINASSDYVAFQNNVYADTLCKQLDAALSIQAQDVSLAICNTMGLARYAESLGVAKTKVVALGTSLDLFGTHVCPTSFVSHKSDQLNVVWSGNPYAPWHDFDTIQKATWRLRDNDKIKFYFIGEYPKGFQFADNVIFKGSITYTEMPHYLKAMDVGLAIYKNPTWSRYGMFSSPLKLFDYFASALIVVSSPIETVVQCIEDEKTGYIIPFENDEYLANKLEYIADHKLEFSSMRNAVREKAVTYFNWQRVAQETVNAIEETLSSKKG